MRGCGVLGAGSPDPRHPDLPLPRGGTVTGMTTQTQTAAATAAEVAAVFGRVPRERPEEINVG
jgi:hypothetical protein